MFLVSKGGWISMRSMRSCSLTCPETIDKEIKSLRRKLHVYS